MVFKGYKVLAGQASRVPSIRGRLVGEWSATASGGGSEVGDESELGIEVTSNELRQRESGGGGKGVVDVAQYSCELHNKTVH
jgi:hypothetical protein